MIHKQDTFGCCYGCHRIEICYNGRCPLRCMSNRQNGHHVKDGWDYMIDYIKTRRS